MKNIEVITKTNYKLYTATEFLNLLKSEPYDIQDNVNIEAYRIYDVQPDEVTPELVDKIVHSPVIGYYHYNIKSNKLRISYLNDNLITPEEFIRGKKYDYDRKLSHAGPDTFVIIDGESTVINKNI